MRHPAGHLAQGTQTFLLHHRLLGSAQFIVCLLHAVSQANLIVKVAALFLGGEDLDLQGILLRSNLGNFRANLLGVVTHLLHDQHHHADGNEQLQHGRYQKTCIVKVLILLGKWIAPQVKPPQQEAHGQHAGSDKRYLFPHPVKTNTGEHAAKTN